MAAGIFDETSSFVGGGSTIVDEYVYTTKDLAFDLVSPLLAFILVNFLFQQTSPRWLNVIIYTLVGAAGLVIVLDLHTLDAYLK